MQKAIKNGVSHTSIGKGGLHEVAMFSPSKRNAKIVRTLRVYVQLVGLVVDIVN